MSRRPAETTQLHTRLLKCTLHVEDSRAYWGHWRTAEQVSAQQAFDEYWFGARSLARIKVLLSNFRARFDVVSEALPLLSRWPHMEPGTRQVICHWHLQFSDAMYRSFTGEYLVQRYQGARAEITRDLVVAWVSQQGRSRWTMATKIELASKLLSSAYSAGLFGSNRNPRPIRVPSVRDEGLAYLMYLLRGVDFAGTLLENPYVASVGLDRGVLEERLAGVPGLRLRRQGDLLDFEWQYPGLGAWGDALLGRSTEITSPTMVLEGRT